MTKLRKFGNGSLAGSPTKTLRPFGSPPIKKGSSSSTRSTASDKPSRHSSSGNRTDQIRSKTSTSTRSSATRSSATREKKRLLDSSTPWSERLSYLVQRGFLINKVGEGRWIIVDRFSVPCDGEAYFDNPVDAQKYADELNDEIFQLRLKELTGRA